MREKVAAFFDVDGTLLRGDIVRYYAFFRRRRLEALPKILWTMGLVLRAPLLMLQDRISREWFAKKFYRGYRSISPEELEEAACALFEEEMRGQFYAQALTCVKRHLVEGHQVVLISGSIRHIVEQVAQYVDATAVLCVDLELAEKRFTGQLTGTPLTGQHKARSLRRFARDNGIDLNASFAYADSADDIPMLEQVGTAAAINPDRRLLAVARNRGWKIRSWGLSARTKC
jgi:HAD superfamily hydrolase (TIGR01490 family)